MTFRYHRVIGLSFPWDLPIIMVCKLMTVCKVWLLVLALVSISGCSSLISHSQYKVSIDSLPSGTTIVIRDTSNEIVGEGTTPAEFLLPSYGAGFQPASYQIQVTDDQQRIYEENLKASVSPTIFGNVLVGVLGVVTVLIDFYTGAVYDLPRQFDIVLDNAKTADGVSE